METTQIIAYLEGHLSLPEQETVTAWIQESDEHFIQFQEVKRIWEASVDTPPAVSVEGAWQKVKPQLEQSGKKPAKVMSLRRLRAWSTAAVMLLAVSAYWFWLAAPEPEWEAVATNAVSNEVIALADQSTVHLNADSKLSYPESFGRKERRVKLEGEAFFDIARDESKPFIIEAGETSVQVLGTSFNVMAYPDSQFVQVQVVSGRVAFQGGAAQGEKVILNAGESAVFSTVTGRMLMGDAMNQNALGWFTKRFAFEEQELDEVISLLEHSYHHQITVENEALRDCLLTASFEDQTLEEIIDVLSFIYNVKIIKDDQHYRLVGGSCE